MQNNARLVMAAALTVILPAAHAFSDETLLLEGPTPKISFVANDPTDHTWTLFADEIAVDLHNSLGSTWPFHISPNCPTNSLFVHGESVGLGTNNPLSKFHVHKAANWDNAERLARFTVDDDETGGLFINNGSATDGVFIPKIIGRSAGQNAALVNEAVITADAGASPAIAFNAVKGEGGGLVTRPLVVYRNNNVPKVTIAANGSITATSFNPSSSRALKHDIVELDSHRADEALRQLTPVVFVYNNDEAAEKRVGFIAEDVPDLVADADRKSVPIMDVVATLTRVVKDQQQAIEKQQTLNDELRRSRDEQQQFNQSLMRRLMELERRNP